LKAIVAYFKPLKAALNPICHLLALLGAHHILHVSRIRVKIFTQNSLGEIINTFCIGMMIMSLLNRIRFKTGNEG
jgi:hypothetical protein